MRPLGKGIPRRPTDDVNPHHTIISEVDPKPATPVVKPSRKMSQWKPAGFRRGNSVPWAMSDDTVDR